MRICSSVGEALVFKSIQTTTKGLIRKDDKRETRVNIPKKIPKFFTSTAPSESECTLPCKLYPIRRPELLLNEVDHHHANIFTESFIMLLIRSTYFQLVNTGSQQQRVMPQFRLSFAKLHTVPAVDRGKGPKPTEWTDWTLG
jgi:hypothetical protein